MIMLTEENLTALRRSPQAAPPKRQGKLALIVLALLPWPVAAATQSVV